MCSGSFQSSLHVDALMSCLAGFLTVRMRGHGKNVLSWDETVPALFREEKSRHKFHIVIKWQLRNLCISICLYILILCVSLHTLPAVSSEFVACGGETPPMSPCRPPAVNAEGGTVCLMCLLLIKIHLCSA